MDTVLELTRLSGPVFALNPDLIERAEATPDTVVTLVNGSKYVIRESLDELITLIREYRISLVAAAQATPGFSASSTYHHQSASAARSSAVRRDATTTGTVVALHPEEQ
jgi:flagellar protein FlbD